MLLKSASAATTQLLLDLVFPLLSVFGTGSFQLLHFPWIPSSPNCNPSPNAFVLLQSNQMRISCDLHLSRMRCLGILATTSWILVH